MSRGGEEGQGQEADLRGGPPSSGGGDRGVWGPDPGLQAQKAASGHLHHGLGSAPCSLRHSGLR